jgi:hypothetical protein
VNLVAWGGIPSAYCSLAFAGTRFESQTKLVILLSSLLEAAMGIAVLLTIRPIKADST